jgi:uncharacterized membrane protein
MLSAARREAPASPSAWSKRLPVLVTAAAGCGIATYLTLYQVGALSHVWEPFFGSGSRFILKESAIARYMPVPDAALGAAAYLAELILELIGGEDRWRTRPWVVLLLGATAAGLAVAAIVLVVCQAAVFRQFCTLCLASAACSLVGAAFACPEVLATLRHLRRRRAAPTGA